MVLEDYTPYIQTFLNNFVTKMLQIVKNVNMVFHYTDMQAGP